jgi:DNA-binding transcriptional regulator YdaS (Cro superfamily)
MSSEEYQEVLRELAQWGAVRGRKQQLADEMGVSHALVSLWIIGKRPLSLEQWISIKKIIRRKQLKGKR